MKIAERQFAISESIAHAELDGEAILLEVENGVYYGLDPIGFRIWQILAETGSESEVHRRLLEEYEVDPDQLRRDVSDFLRLLLARGLVRELSERV